MYNVEKKIDRHNQNSIHQQKIETTHQASGFLSNNFVQNTINIKIDFTEYLTRGFLGRRYVDMYS